jgi:hypothetical protein
VLVSSIAFFIAYPVLFSAPPTNPVATVEATGKRFDQNRHPKLLANLTPKRLQQSLRNRTTAAGLGDKITATCLTVQNRLNGACL